MVRRLGRTRIALLSLVVIGLGVFFLIEPALPDDLLEIVASLEPEALGAIGLAVALVLAGHFLRALRSKIAIDQAYRASFSTHFGALSIGYLFNALLPLRVGEVMRTFLLARKLRISFLYTFTVIVVERLLDVMLVSALFLVGVLIFPDMADTTAVILAFVSLFISVAVTWLFFVLVSGSGRLRTVIRLTTSWLSEPLRRRFQFSVWTVVYGFQKFRAQPRQVSLYLGAFAASWVCYLSAAALLVLILFPEDQQGDGGWMAGTLGPFVASSISVMPIYPATFVDALVAFIASGTRAPSVATASLGLIVWAAITAPIALIGLAWIFFFSVLSLRSTSSYIAAQLPDHGNKLDRMTSVGQGMPEFIDGWFRGENLVHVLHELEVRGDLTLVKVFKGGSNAVTVLSQVEDGQQVKKIVPAAHADKLEMQRDWLHEHRGLEGIVRLDGEERGTGYYAINLDYRPTTVPFFDYIHSTPLEKSIEVVSDVWDFMFNSIYTLTPPKADAERRDAYISDRLVDRVRSVATLDESIARAIAGETIVVNGRELLNFEAVFSSIRSNEEAWADLAWFQSSGAVHGDLTIDNILVDIESGRFLLIDPSDDNQIRGPIIDMARHMQSLSCGYEFLNADATAVQLEHGTGGGPFAISFADTRSMRYDALARFVDREVLIPRFSEPERRSVPFHVGLLYGRMLPHRVVIDPATVLKYYGTSIVALNTFLRQYK